MRIGINCGHTVEGTVGSGATGFLSESDETRAVGYALIENLRERGIEVIDCTNDRADSVLENLRKICELANAQPLDMFLSIHFNAGGGRGSEAYTYDGEDRADAGKILTSLEGLGFRNRGIKDGSGLYVIRNTIAPAALLEVCFVDNRDDAELYREVGAEQIAEAICRAITGNEEELTMSQYEEIKALLEVQANEIRAIAQTVAELSNPMIYNFIDDNMPVWARPTIEKLVSKGYLQGDDNGLGLTDEMLRIFVVNDRAGLYD